ncbi:hypothetical protein J4Q44_G00387370 [Coregonus suidteri]|uniref:Uncharacterized protein n=1 Tax=Coregonus suidteri TaxID=861788 RepID=A0AAN8KEH3_9TELE
MNLTSGTVSLNCCLGENTTVSTLKMQGPPVPLSLMAQCGWLGLVGAVRADWRCSIEVSGGRCVTMDGLTLTHRWCVDSWGTDQGSLFLLRGQRSAQVGSFRRGQAPSYWTM